MMNTDIQIKAIFKFRQGSIVMPAPSIEVSLDCFMCKKCNRTVVLKKDKNNSFCTTTFYTRHPFNGCIKKIRVNEIKVKKFFSIKILTEIIYDITYEYREFIDKRNKYADNNSNPLPNWARIYFNITCPKCHYEQRKFTQNNLHIPFTAVCDKCSCKLYKQTDKLPVFEMKN